MSEIKSYLKNYNNKKPMVLIGDSGSGKSSVMAKAVQTVEEERKGVLVYRFIGTTSGSSGIVSLLQSVCGQVAREFGTTLEILAGEGREKSLYDINGITEIFKKCLALATAQKPVIVFLDALDQLSDADNAKSLHWMPRELPEHARLVVSALPELEGSLSANRLEHLPVLPQQEAQLILDRWFQSISRKLTNEQRNEIFGKFSHTGLPIYLKLAFEQAKHWHSYTTSIKLQDDVRGIINSLMESLEHEHGRELVENVICYMLCGRYQGLAENEILEILVFDKEFWEGKFLPLTHPEHRDELKDVTKIPIVVWSRLFLDLEPFLTERDADGVPIITFFHRQFVEVLRKRYQIDE
jgi:NACHT domain- and WD repeat-containing protein